MTEKEQSSNKRKYKVKFKEIIIYEGYIDMNEEEYKKLCEGDKDILINRIRTSAIFPKRRFEEELVEFCLLKEII